MLFLESLEFARDIIFGVEHKSIRFEDSQLESTQGKASRICCQTNLGLNQNWNSDKTCQIKGVFCWVHNTGWNLT